MTPATTKPTANPPAASKTSIPPVMKRIARSHDLRVTKLQRLHETLVDLVKTEVDNMTDLHTAAVDLFPKIPANKSEK